MSPKWTNEWKKTIQFPKAEAEKKEIIQSNSFTEINKTFENMKIAFASIIASEIFLQALTVMGNDH